MAIITDEKILRTPCQSVQPSEVDELISTLEKELNEYNRLNPSNGGIGLACPQIGIAKQAAIIRLSEKCSVNLVNCRIAKAYDEFVFENEGCLSFPGLRVSTKRYNEIYVVDNLVEPHSFIATSLFAVAIQHELAHLNNILLPDIAIKPKPPKQAPNELCLCGSGIKYKKCCARK